MTTLTCYIFFNSLNHNYNHFIKTILPEAIFVQNQIELKTVIDSFEDNNILVILPANTIPIIRNFENLPIKFNLLQKNGKQLVLGLYQKNLWNTFKDKKVSNMLMGTKSRIVSFYKDQHNHVKNQQDIYFDTKCDFFKSYHTFLILNKHEQDTTCCFIHSNGLLDDILYREYNKKPELLFNYMKNLLQFQNHLLQNGKKIYPYDYVLHVLKSHFIKAKLKTYLDLSSIQVSSIQIFKYPEMIYLTTNMMLYNSIVNKRRNKKQSYLLYVFCEIISKNWGHVGLLINQKYIVECIFQGIFVYECDEKELQDKMPLSIIQMEDIELNGTLITLENFLKNGCPSLDLKYNMLYNNCSHFVKKILEGNNIIFPLHYLISFEDTYL